MGIFNDMQQKWQKKWDEAKVFEASPKEGVPKFFMTIPYPYISGSLHIGHARVVTEADVFVRFQRMTGKNVLYPIAFHISGTPVLGISLAIKNGDKKKIELYKGYVIRYVSDEKEADKIVKSFADPQKIVDFFIPKMKDEFKTLGLSVDWRRSYTSGDMEHQALVEWQFRKYKDKKYLVQGKYPILFSKSLNNAVGEDDIQDGDTDPVDVQEFTAIKFKFGDDYLVAATLRPETMYGQTNMWANPNIEYVKAKVDDEIWIISKECADKLKYQDKKIEIVGKVKGLDLMGKKCFAPFVEREIMILPSMHCDPKIGTGIVTSVPSDAPFDWIALKELQDSNALCDKYHLDHGAVKAIKLIPIIKSKDYGDFPAVDICKKIGVTKLSQHDKLTQATQEIYKVGFHTGIMRETCGPYKGMPVTQAKELMKKELLKKKKADLFYETSRLALSRDGGEVIVAILDNQWFLDFNAKGWKDLAGKALAQTEIWPDKYRKQFEDVFAWLDKRPCARKRGLGTKLPFDTGWVIESLSDSTIYMALYPIVHLIRKNKLKKEQLNSEFFEYVMNSKGDLEKAAKNTGIPKEVLKEMNKEWNYWYPFDQRHTFTAHLSNHLSFMIFAHTAVFDKKYWPKRISFHGMVISEGEKMSKSKGNVVTLMDLNERFGSDPFRAFMCSSTSVESTFNWESDKVEIMGTHLKQLLETINELQSNKKESKDYLKFRSFVSKTERAIKNATESLKAMDIRKYSNIILYEMLNNYKKVRKLASESELKSINAYVGNRWVMMLSPLVPHLAEELWSLDKRNNGFVSTATWPTFNAELIDDAAEYEDEMIDLLRKDISTVMKLAKIEKPKKITLFVSAAWKYDFFKMLKKELDATSNPGDVIKKLMATELKKYGQEITKLVPALVRDRSKLPEIVLDQKKEYSQLSSLNKVLKQEFGCEVVFVKAEDSQEAKAKQAMPGKPAIVLE
ncbi:MAG: leucine--tRNA ligase [Nanoarchaeota archaeon]|nr:leucine--tRNA ligase [Nanoarchaeota archaeon]